MAATEYKKLKNWGDQHLGKFWNKQLCNELGISESVPAKLRERRRLGLKMTMKLMSYTDLTFSDLGYPELEEAKPNDTF